MQARARAREALEYNLKIQEDFLEKEVAGLQITSLGREEGIPSRGTAGLRPRERGL